MNVINDLKGDSNLLHSQIPTDNNDVIALLRKLQQPKTFFGENNYDRRQRLIRVISELPHTDFNDNIQVDNDVGMEEGNDGDGDGDSEDSDEEEFYTPGPPELLECRKDILKYSLHQARTRINNEKQQQHDTDFIKILKHRRNINHQLKKTELFGTQLVNSQRPLSSITYSPDNKLIACGGWDGYLYIFDDQLQTKFLEKQHTEKVGGLDWNEELLITGGNEGKINLWNIDPELKVINSIDGHNARITKTLIHPNGKYFASTSFDQTWKLWDLNSNELVQQEGHLKEIFSGAFHPDGSIFATGGLDAIGKLWDLRSGRLINNLTSHIQGIYSMDWSPNGTYLATGSGDCSIKIWDLRMLDNRHGINNKPELFSIPAHKKLVSDVKFYSNNNINSQSLTCPVTDENNNNPQTLSANGQFLVSTSYDNTMNIWSSDNWIKVAELSLSDKGMACSISSSGTSLINCNWDKNLNLWSIPLN